MAQYKKEHPAIKSKLHPRNKHRERYNFESLTKTSPDLKNYVAVNKYGDESINFFDHKAVKALNKALLKHFYNIPFWDIPDNYLCPPIPGRADYLHYIADLLVKSNEGKIPNGEKIKVLDIGIGANCVYPLLGAKEYSWNFVGSDIDKVALQNAEAIVSKNKLAQQIVLREQANKNNYFQGIIKPSEQFDLTICNPPFHGSYAEAQGSSHRKLKNLTKELTPNPVLNFGGKSNELWCDGGEAKFVKNMLEESKHFGKNCYWFTSLISKESTIKMTYPFLKELGATEYTTIGMGQGNKVSRLLVWSFLTRAEQLLWAKEKWQN